jgi:TPR repeat protein
LSLQLPAELFHATVCDYLSCWGDLARLASVQKSWSAVMYDAAQDSSERQWDLACALLEGTDGLRVNTGRAVQLLLELAEVGVEYERADRDVLGPMFPIFDREKALDNNNNNTTEIRSEYAAKAMKKLAFWHLEEAAVVAAEQQLLKEEEQDKEHDSASSSSSSSAEPKPEARSAAAAAGLAWLQCAFEAAGDIDAAHDLALIHEYARYGVPTDVVAAAAWFERAASAGHVEAMAELGLCYELGCGVDANDETALDWYMRAANAGHVTAKFSVGEAFEEARGVPQSDEEACLWYYKAALAGDEDSRRALQRLQDIARIVVPGVRALLFDE